MEQNRITEKTRLLNEQGGLTNPGYAVDMLFEYSRKDIKAKKLRIKEWDYYFVGNADSGVALTIADNGYMGFYSVTLFNFKTKFWHTKTMMKLLTLGKTKLPSTSAEGDVEVRGKGYVIRFTNDGKTRRLYSKWDDFHNMHPLEINVTLTDAPKDSMVIATPFKEKPKAFYFNQKINCLKASGFAKFGANLYSFDDNGSLGVLDWGRGVWTYKNTWYWGSLSCYLPSGETFGFNIGYGFGDTSKATENMLFYNGTAHKLSKVTFNIPMKDGKDDFMGEWAFTSDDGRFEMKFVPILDRQSKDDLKIITSIQHQVFGLFSGTAILDDGTKIELDNVMGFAEKVFNKW